MPGINSWTLRGAARPTRRYNFCISIRHAYCVKSYNPSNNSKNVAGHHGKDKHVTGGCAFSENFPCGSSFPAKFFSSCRSLSLEAGEGPSSSEHDDAFSNLETPVGNDKIGCIRDHENDGNLVSEEFESNSESEEDSAEIADYSLGSAESETVSPLEKESTSTNLTSPLFRLLMETSDNSVNSTLEKWVEEGNPLGRAEVSITMLHLRKRRLFGKALQFAEWLEATKRLNFVEHDYASHLDLVGKVHGLRKAENYIDKIPGSFRGEVVYRTLLANCVAALNVKKAEEVFHKIRDLGLPITTFSCNQLLLLYKRVDHKKVADVLLMMEKEFIKPSMFTYRLLIDLKGRTYDIAGMEQIVEKMKAEGMYPDIMIQAIVAGFYISGGLKEKAEAALKEMEGEDIQEKHSACKALLPLYAALGNADDVGRVWKACETNLRLDEGLVFIKAWGEVGCVEKAEEVLEKLLKKWKKLSSKYYIALLRVYANHKLLTKGANLVKQMKDNGCKIGPSTWNALTKLYVGVGEVENADSLLQKVAEKNNFRPLYSSYVTLLDAYSKRGDVRNAEKIFHKLKKTGCRGRMKLYQLLLEAYLNAKSPAYGFRERMRADNIFPNKHLAELLVAVDAIGKTQAQDLTDGEVI